MIYLRYYFILLTSFFYLNISGIPQSGESIFKFANQLVYPSQDYGIIGSESIKRKGSPFFSVKRNQQNELESFYIRLEFLEEYYILEEFKRTRNLELLPYSFSMDVLNYLKNNLDNQFSDEHSEAIKNYLYQNQIKIEDLNFIQDQWICQKKSSSQFVCKAGPPPSNMLSTFDY